MRRHEHRLKRLERGATVERPMLIAFVPIDWASEKRASHIARAARECGLEEPFETMIHETVCGQPFRAEVVSSLSVLLDGVAVNSSRIGVGD